MRIIAGIAKGKKLLPPDGMQTRPTLDRVKENIFNIIQNRIEDAVVIDVFAGTGSLGLEAVSRGAKECYLVDKHPTTFKNLKENVKNLRFEDKCVCLNKDSYMALKDLGKKKKIFDLIFIDPPYAKEMIPPAIKIVHEESLLHKDGLIVTKIDSSEKIYEGDEKIKIVDHRKYGNTTVCFYKYKEE
ncbi:16S rRNA (guanine(966)-N(2))-methyltransferase RsmD [Clostridium sp.]|jgi:16S rRNA (guanine966-N2)-methyltransferase|uniref:16S rRNA (guanine(966)-N(2))-methyltransferase RsmD n=1 Tax=Clostridium sp. TaxID=1506 RepID=UPI0039F565C9